MSEELPSASSEVTKLYYFIDDEETPYQIKIAKAMGKITLGDFKAAVSESQTKYHINHCKFFFKTTSEDLGGPVKEELSDDSKILPQCDGKIFAYLQPTEGSAHSDGSSGRRGPGMGSMRGLAQPAYIQAAAAFDQTGMSSDTEESTLSNNLPQFGKALNRRAFQPQYGTAGRRGLVAPRRTDNESALTTDTETRLYSDDDDRSRVSESTHVTSVSQQFYRQRKRRKKHRAPVSRATSFSSITESSMSLNIITVPLNMDTVNFLGISIVGQSNRRGDGGIFVANIMKGGAVALDGRIEPGDMILQVNKTSFENMSNDDAVAVLRDAVSGGGRITLVVAKSWDPAPKGYFTIPRQEPVRPIDPGAWVAHTNQFNRHGAPLDTIGEAPTPTPGGYRPPSVSTLTSHQSGGSYGSSGNATERYVGGGEDLDLDKDMDPKKIVMAMMRPRSGLEIKDRTWLKIKVPRAVLGSDVVDWLHTKVQGFPERRDARKYAAHLLKQGLIKHTVNKITFSEQCYYVFADFITHEMGRLGLMPLGQHGLESEAGMILPSRDGRMDGDGGMSDGDTVGPLPPPSLGTPTPPWLQGGTMETARMGTALLTAPANTPSMVSGYASMIGPGPSAYPFAVATPSAPAAVLSQLQPEQLTLVGSNASGGSSSSERSKKLLLPPVPPKPLRPPQLPSPGSDLMLEMCVEERDLAGSRQSFRMAMGNPLAPTEFFVDYM